MGVMFPEGVDQFGLWAGTLAYGLNRALFPQDLDQIGKLGRAVQVVVDDLIGISLAAACPTEDVGEAIPDFAITIPRPGRPGAA